MCILITFCVEFQTVSKLNRADRAESNLLKLLSATDSDEPPKAPKATVGISKPKPKGGGTSDFEYMGYKMGYCGVLKK